MPIGAYRCLDALLKAARTHFNTSPLWPFGIFVQHFQAMQLQRDTGDELIKEDVASFRSWIPHRVLPSIVVTVCAIRSVNILREGRECTRLPTRAGN